MLTNAIFNSHFIPGEISGSGQTKCILCPAGYACPNASNPSQNTPCQNGTYSIAGASICTPCTAGKYCPSTQ